MYEYQAQIEDLEPLALASLRRRGPEAVKDGSLFRTSRFSQGKDTLET
jgi:hypothetical protein